MKRAVNSVINQTYTDFECIVVDDASSDDTPEVINLFNDNRLVYVRNEFNKGASASRNNEIRLAKGELISFLDDDDEWMNDKLEKQVDLLEKSSFNVGLVYCWMSYIVNDVMLKNYTPRFKGHIFQDMLDKQVIGNSSTLLVRRKVIDEIGGFDELLLRGNDGDFIRRVCKKYEVDFVPEIQVKVYVDHGQSRISDNDPEGIKNHIISGLAKIRKFQMILDRFPEQKANIFFDLARSYLKLRDYHNFFYYYLKAYSFFPYSKRYLTSFASDLKSLISTQLK